MSDEHKGEWTFEVGGATYTATLKTWGLKELQKHFSTPTEIADLNDIFRKVNERSIEHQLAMFWAALRKYHPDVTMERASDLVDALGGVAMLRGMFETLDRSMQPDPEDAAELRGDEAHPSPAQTQTPTASTGEPSALALASSV